MSEKDQKAPPTPHEIHAFQSIANAQRLVFLPVQFNGAPRFAMGILHEDARGGNFIQVVGILSRADDTIVSATGEHAATIPPSQKNNMN